MRSTRQSQNTQNEGENGGLAPALQGLIGIPAAFAGKDLPCVLHAIRGVPGAFDRHPGMGLPAADDDPCLASPGPGTALRAIGLGMPECGIVRGAPAKPPVLVPCGLLPSIKKPSVSMPWLA